MPSLEWNLRTWNDRHDWSSQGDEWSGMADYCRQPYDAWKQGLVDTFISPHLGPSTDVLEIAPGHGRWSEVLVRGARQVELVDLSPACIEACRARFADAHNVSYHVNDGSAVPLPDQSVDFIWSFDSFVHMEPPVVDAYVAEFARVLRPGGAVVLHHADRRDWSLRLLPAAEKLGVAGRVAVRLAGQGRLRDSGRRSAVSGEVVARIVAAHGLSVVRQVSSWGPGGRYSVDKYRDTITTAAKPVSRA